MPNISFYKYFGKLIYHITRKRYEKVMRDYIKIIEKNMLPTKKIIDYDGLLEKIVDKIINDRNIFIEQTNIIQCEKKELILSSEIYDTGGHTELAIRYIKANPNIPIYCYVINSFKRSGEYFDKLVKGNILKEISEDYYISDKNISLDDKIFEAFNYILNNKISQIIVNIHMQDAIGSAILYLIKKYTNISIVFWNHGDHWFSLGTKYADVIYTRMKNGKALTPYLENNPTCKSGKFIINYDKNDILTQNEIIEIKKQLGIPLNCFLTMTGCGLGKLNKHYFQLITKILEKNNNIYHLFVCSDYPNNEQKIKKLFKYNKNVIVISSTPKFEKYIQITDLYIDSFPQGSALTLLDYIKYKKPVVIKINEKEPYRSFETYLYPNYEYAFKTTNEMLKGILELSTDKEKYNNISEKVWKFFEGEYVKQ